MWGYVNEAPEIEALLPTSVEAGMFEFRSVLRDQELLTYAWDFGDGNSSSFARPLHAYAEEGNYTITLTVSDGEYTATVTDSADTADTENAPPVADAGPDITAAPGETVTLDGTGSYDPDEYPLTSIRYTWSSPDGLAISSAGDRVATVTAPSEPGTYLIQLLVNDGAESSTDTMVLTVETA